MPSSVPVTAEKGLIGKVEYGGDLLDELTDLCIEQQIHLGRIEAIGALQKARLGYYKQVEREYQYFELDRSAEITSLVGNISLKDGDPMVHVHLTVSDDTGKTYGGHLAKGCLVFACEYVVMKLAGTTLERSFDQTTGLPLWHMGPGT